MELYIKNSLNDITYKAEFTPTPIVLSHRLNSQLVWGLNSRTLIE